MKTRFLNGSLVALLATAGFSFSQSLPIAPSSDAPPVASTRAAVQEPASLSTPGGGTSPYWPVQQVSASAPNPDPAPVPPSNGNGQAGTSDGPMGCADSAASCRGTQFWASAEFLLWWIRDGNLPAVVGAAPASLAGVNQLPPGAINPIFGGIGPHLDYHEHTGGRVTLGYWLDAQQSLGVDAGYFQLEHKVIRFSASSTGDPLLGPVYNDPVQARQVLVVAASPGVVNGRVDINANERFWGVEANVRTACTTCFSDRFELFAGFRHLEFDEGLTINTNATLLPTLPAVGGTNFNFLDSFGTHNRFYGPQVGLRTDYQWGNWALTFISKIALGDLTQIVNITGFSTLTQPGAAPVSHVGSILALPSNIGHHSRDRFSAVPEETINLSYQVTSSVRAFIGYNFLLITDVVRPGDQIDGVDGRQIPLLSGFDPTVRATRPAVRFKETDFWAQGINFGVEFRY